MCITLNIKGWGSNWKWFYLGALQIFVCWKKKLMWLHLRTSTDVFCGILLIKEWKLKKKIVKIGLRRNLDSLPPDCLTLKLSKSLKSCLGCVPSTVLGFVNTSSWLWWRCPICQNNCINFPITSQTIKLVDRR